LFNHLNLAKKEEHQYHGTKYEIAVYRAEDGHLHGYISAGGFCDSIGEMSSEVAYDMKTTNEDDPVECLINAMKGEIDSGKFHVAKRT
jgi:hypothetical protein